MKKAMAFHRWTLDAGRASMDAIDIRYKTNRQNGIVGLIEDTRIRIGEKRVDSVFAYDGDPFE